MVESAGQLKFQRFVTSAEDFGESEESGWGLICEGRILAEIEV